MNSDYRLARLALIIKRDPFHSASELLGIGILLGSERQVYVRQKGFQGGGCRDDFHIIKFAIFGQYTSSKDKPAN